MKIDREREHEFEALPISGYVNTKHFLWAHSRIDRISQPPSQMKNFTIEYV
jgi:hypothetical protein